MCIFTQPGSDADAPLRLVGPLSPAVDICGPAIAPAHAISLSIFGSESVPPRLRDHDLAELYRRVAGHDYSPSHCRKPSEDEASDHPPAEAGAVRKQLLGGAMRAAG